MSFNVRSIPPFDKQLKRLSKKYVSLKSEYQVLLTDLEQNPTVNATPIKYGCYKRRLIVASKNKGKSGGLRVIFTILVQDQNVILLSVYDKSEADSITNNELANLLKQL